MTQSEELISNFFKQFKEIELLNSAKNKELSEIDKRLSNLYHEIEGAEITHVSQSHNYIKELKEVLSVRRVLKLETIILRSTYDNIKQSFGKAIDSYKDTLKKNDILMENIKNNLNKNVLEEQKDGNNG